MKNILVIGNGLSSKEIQFSKLKVDTFCVNNSYKIFDKINFYPTYFGSFDKRHIKENKEDYINLIRNSEIKNFFMPKKFMIDYPEDVLSNEKLINVDMKFVKRANQLKYVKDFNNFVDGGNSGINAVLSSYILKYENIYIIGCDANYDNKSINENDTDSEIVTKLNNSYFIDNYYENESDKQFIPTLRFHIPFWKVLSRRKPKDVNIYNCSPISNLKAFFKYYKLEDVYDLN